MGALGALVAAGVVAVSVASFSGAAFAQTPKNGDDTRARYEELLAQKLGISVDSLTEAQKAVRDQLVDEAVAAGKLTAEQAEKIKAGELGALGRFGGPGGFGPFGEMRGDHKNGGPGIAKEVISSVFEAAAKVIGIDESQLRQDLASGKSLVDIAGAKGVSREQLKTGMTTDLKADIAQAQADGVIDQAMADRLTQALEQRLDDVIDGKAGDGMRFEFRMERPLNREGGMPGDLGGRFFQRGPR